MATKVVAVMNAGVGCSSHPSGTTSFYRRNAMFFGFNYPTPATASRLLANTTIGKRPGLRFSAHALCHAAYFLIEKNTGVLILWVKLNRPFHRTLS